MSLQSFAIIGGGKKENREDNDFYPTPWECTVALMDFIGLHKSKKVWEPACGNGAMSEVIKSYGHFVVSTDLRHSGYGEGGVDFLKSNPMKTDAIITNPPFNVAEEFIKRALQDAPIVAMLLKSQFWHAKKRQALFNNNTPAYILPMTWRPDFLGGGSPTMDCIWTVWIDGRSDAKYCPLSKPILNKQETLF